MLPIPRNTLRPFGAGVCPFAALRFQRLAYLWNLDSAAPVPENATPNALKTKNDLNIIKRHGKRPGIGRFALRGHRLRLAVGPNGMLKTGAKPASIYANYASGETPLPAKYEEANDLLPEAWQEKFLLCFNNPQVTESGYAFRNE